MLLLPVFFLGRKDDFVPAETSAAYFDALAAPSKELVWFEQSGHEPFVDEPAGSMLRWCSWSAEVLLGPAATRPGLVDGG